MKKIVCIVIYCVCLVCSVKATGQMGELVIIGSDTLEMLNAPLEADSLLRTRVAERLSGSWSTGCYRGYQGIWRLENNTLYLEKLIDYCSFNYDTSRITLVDLKGIFDSYLKDGRVVASWYTGELKVAWGEMLFYRHIGFAREYEYERAYQIEAGKVVKQTEWHNSFRKADEWPIEDAMKLVSSHFNGDRLALGEEDRVDFSVSVRPKADGSLDSMDVFFRNADRKWIRNDYTHPYVQELKKCLDLVPQWEVLKIRDKIQPVSGWSLPVWKGKGCKAVYQRGQIRDVLYLNDTSYMLQAFPLQYDMNVYERLGPYLKGAYTPDCLRGYFAIWKIEDNNLCLQGVRHRQTTALLPLDSVFHQEQGEAIKAYWFWGQLLLWTGGPLVNTFSLDDIYRKEVVCEVEKGRVTKLNTYHNYFRPGDWKALKRCEQELLQSDWTKFTELNDKSLRCRYVVQPDKDGKAMTIQLTVFVNGSRDESSGKQYHQEITDPVHPYVKIFRTKLETIPVWERLYVRGEIRPVTGYIDGKEK